LVSLRLQGVHQESPLKRHSAVPADCLNLFEFTIGQRAGIMQKATYEGRFSVINVANNDDA
jgi:hypothetical protein